MTTGPTATQVANSGGNFIDNYGTMHRHVTINVTGMTYANGGGTGQNAIPHGLPYTPLRASYRPGPNGLWGELQAPDATYVYIQIGNGGALSGNIDVEE